MKTSAGTMWKSRALATKQEKIVRFFDTLFRSEACTKLQENGGLLITLYLRRLEIRSLLEGPIDKRIAQKDLQRRGLCCEFTTKRCKGRIHDPLYNMTFVGRGEYLSVLRIWPSMGNTLKKNDE